jgi:hypothetical protein
MASPYTIASNLDNHRLFDLTPRVVGKGLADVSLWADFAGSMRTLWSHLRPVPIIQNVLSCSPAPIIPEIPR